MSSAPTIRRPPPRSGERVDARRASEWSPLAVIAIGIGIGYVALGVAGLARTGLALGHLDHPYTEIIGFRHSPLLGVAEVVLGALLLIDGLVGGGRTVMALLGALATATGLVLLVDVMPATLHRWLGVGDPYGWLSLIVGVFLLLTAFFLPDVSAEDRRRVHHHIVT